MRGARVTLLTIVTIALAPAALGAQQRWERQVRERLARAIAALGAPSSAPVVTRSGTLNAEEGAAFQTTLVERGSYAIVAVCDDDCTRLQLTLLSPSGSELAKDRNSESLPLLRFTAPATTAYGVRVSMEACRWNPCWYAVAVIRVGNAPPQ